MEKMKKSIENFYRRIRMGYEKDTRFNRIAISFCEYILYPEFRIRTFPIKKILKVTAFMAVIYFMGAVLLNNLVLLNTIGNKDKELKGTYEEISNLYSNAKETVYDECMDSLLNTESYIRFNIYSKSGILVPSKVPDNHLLAIKDNAEKMNIPLSIYVRVIHHESRFDSSAVNLSSGAMGYMQMMPGTFRHFYDVLSLKGGNTSLNNLMCGSLLLKQKYEYWYKRKKDQGEAWQMALACYAMGDSLPRALDRVPESVKGYVNYVMQNEIIQNTKRNQ